MVSAIKSIAIAFSNTFPDDDKIANMPRLVFQSISLIESFMELVRFLLGRFDFTIFGRISSH